MKVFLWYLWYSCTVFRLGDFGISSDKCQEYAEAVYSQQYSPVMMLRSPVSNIVSNCGIVSTPLIIGGTNVVPKEFPHQAVIGFGTSPDAKLSWDCGGALISDVYVLTAAHCLSSRFKGDSQKVRFGIVDLVDPEADDLQELQIVERIGHPEFNRLTKANDIALLRLEGPVEFTAYVRPACLNTLPKIPQTRAIATGFGKLQYDSEEGSRDLMKVTLNIYDGSECAKSMGRGVMSPFRDGIPETILCVGNLEGGKDTCQGDSGGPLQVILQEPYCMYSLIGVTSFGKFCGFASSPAIYTNVEKYIPWIEKIVWPEED